MDSGRFLDRSSLADSSNLSSVYDSRSYADSAPTSPVPTLAPRRSYQADSVDVENADLSDDSSSALSARVQPWPDRSPIRGTRLGTMMPVGSSPLSVPPPLVPARTRLKHLQTHMKQLRGLYQQEVHQEELAQRDAFLQTICTSSITLLRHCVSRPRFFTAVRALLCQYLPAPNAKLVQVERCRGKAFLVMQDGQYFQLNQSSSECCGVAGQAVLAATSTGTASERSDASSSTGFLDDNAAYVLPSANGHLALLLPVQKLVQAGYHMNIDLTLQKRELMRDDGTQLLVVVLRDSRGEPAGVIEALLPDATKPRLDFVDGFGVLLAAALETRRAACRSVLADMEIRLVPAHDHAFHSGRDNGVSMSSHTPVLTVPLTNLEAEIVAFGDDAVLPHVDARVLEACRRPIEQLWDQNRALERDTGLRQGISNSLDWLWGQILGIAAFSNPEEGMSGICSVPDCDMLRKYLAGFVSKLIRSGGSRDVESNQQHSEKHGFDIRILFRHESIDTFKNAYRSDGFDGVSDADHQFSILHKALTNVKNQVPDDITVVAVTPSESVDNSRCSDTYTQSSTTSAEIAMMMVVDCEKEPDFGKTIKTLAVPALTRLLQFFLWRIHGYKRALRLEAGIQQAKAAQVVQHQLLDSHGILQDVNRQLLLCTTLEDLVHAVGSAVESPSALLRKVTQTSLFVVEYSQTTTEESKPEPVSSIWTVVNSDRVVLFDRCRGHVSLTETTTGLVVESNEPLSFTCSQHAHRALRRTQKLPESRTCHALYYAVPLVKQCRDKNHRSVIGVVEFAFETQEQFDMFLNENAELKDGLLDIVSSVLEVHLHFSAEQKGFREALCINNEAHREQWATWTQFVSHLTHVPLGTASIDSWNDHVTVLLKELIPSADFVNLLVCAFTTTAEPQTTAMVNLLRNQDFPSLSRLLGVANGSTLSTIAEFALEGNGDLSGEDGNLLGYLVASKKESAPFHEYELNMLALAAKLVSLQVIYLRKRSSSLREKEELESVIEDSKCQQAKLREKHDKATQICLQQQVLALISQFGYSSAFASGTNEQLVQGIIRVMETAATENVSHALPWIAAVIAEAKSLTGWKLVTATSAVSFPAVHTCSEPSRSGEDELDEWFSEQRIVVHQAPFLGLPPKLVRALASGHSNGELRYVQIAPLVARDSDPLRPQVLLGLAVFGETYDDGDHEFIADVAAISSSILERKQADDRRLKEHRTLTDDMQTLNREREALKRSSRISVIAHEAWSHILAETPTTETTGGNSNDHPVVQHMTQLVHERISPSFHELLNATAVEFIMTAGDSNRLQTSTEEAFLERLDPTTRELIQRCDAANPMAFGANQDSIPPRQWFAMRFVNRRGMHLCGLLYVEWPESQHALDVRPQDSGTPTQQNDLQRLAAWLQKMMDWRFEQHYLSSSLAAQEKQCQQALESERLKTSQLEGLQMSRDRWAALQTLLVAMLAAPEASVPPCTTEKVLKEDSATDMPLWIYLTDLLKSLAWPEQTILWVFDERSSHFWTIVSGKKQTWDYEEWRASTWVRNFDSGGSISVALTKEGVLPACSRFSRGSLIGVLELKPRVLCSGDTGDAGLDVNIQTELLAAAVLYSIRLYRLRLLAAKRTDQIQQVQRNYQLQIDAVSTHVASRIRCLKYIHGAARSICFTSNGSGVGAQSSVPELLQAAETALMGDTGGGENGDENGSPDHVTLRARLILDAVVLRIGAENSSRSLTISRVHASKHQHLKLVEVARKLLEQLALEMDGDEATEENLEIDLVPCTCSGPQCTAVRHSTLLRVCLLMLFPDATAKKSQQQGWHVARDSESGATHQIHVVRVCESGFISPQTSSTADHQSARAQLTVVTLSKKLVPTSKHHLAAGMLDAIGRGVLNDYLHLLHNAERENQLTTATAKLASSEARLEDHSARLAKMCQIPRQFLSAVDRVRCSTTGSVHEFILTTLQGVTHEVLGGSVTVELLLEDEVCHEKAASVNSEDLKIAGSFSPTTRINEQLVPRSNPVNSPRAIDRNPLRSRGYQHELSGRRYTLQDSSDKLLGFLVFHGGSEEHDNAYFADGKDMIVESLVCLATCLLSLMRQNAALSTGNQQKQRDWEQLQTESAAAMAEGRELAARLRVSEAEQQQLKQDIEKTLQPISVHALDFMVSAAEAKRVDDVLVALGTTVARLHRVTGVHICEERNVATSRKLFSSFASPRERLVLEKEHVQATVMKAFRRAQAMPVAMGTCLLTGEKLSPPTGSVHRSEDFAVVIVAFTTPEAIRSDPKPRKIREQGPSEPNRDATLPVFVVASIIDTPAHTLAQGDESKLYQREQLKLLGHLARTRCQEIVRSQFRSRQRHLRAERDQNLNQQMAQMEDKCGDLRLKYQVHRRLFYRLTQDLMEVSQARPPALSSSAIAGVWDHLTRLVLQRLQSAWQAPEMSSAALVTRIRLYGLERSSNAVFFLPRTGSGERAKKLQLASLTQLGQGTAGQSLWKAFISGHVVTVDRKSHARAGVQEHHTTSSAENEAGVGGSDTAIDVYIPMTVRRTGDVEGDREVTVGIVEIRTKSALKADAKGELQEFGRSIGIVAEWIGRIIAQKQREQEQERKHQQQRMDRQCYPQHLQQQQLPPPPPATTRRDWDLTFAHADMQSSPLTSFRMVSPDDPTSAVPASAYCDMEPCPAVHNSPLQSATSPFPEPISVLGDNSTFAPSRLGPLGEGETTTHNMANVNIDDDGDCDDDDASMVLRRLKRNRNVPAGMMTFLLMVQATRTCTELCGLVARGFKGIWVEHGDPRKQQGVICELLVWNDASDTSPVNQIGATPHLNRSTLLPSWVQQQAHESLRQLRPTQTPVVWRLRNPVGGVQEPKGPHQAPQEEYWLLHLYHLVEGEGHQEPGRSVVGCLVLSAASPIQAVFDDEDEHIYLPQLAVGIQHQLARLQAITLANEQRAELDLERAAHLELVSKYQDLEAREQAASSFAAFSASVTQLKCPDALRDLLTDHLREYLACQHVAFRSAPGDIGLSFRTSVDEPGSQDLFSQREAVEISNVVKLHIFTPDENLLGICSARLAPGAAPVTPDQYAYLRQVASSVGAAFHRMRLAERLHREQEENEQKAVETQRLAEENAELRTRQQQLENEQQTTLQRHEQREEELASLSASNSLLQAEVTRLRRELEHSAQCQKDREASAQRANTKLAEVSMHLERAGEAEAMVQRAQEEMAVLRSRERALEKKVAKQRLQMKQLESESEAMRRTEAQDKQRLADMETQVAVLHEQRRQHQWQLLQLQRDHDQTRVTREAATRTGPQNCRPSTGRLAEQAQRRQKIALAQELRQMAEMEVRELHRRRDAQQADERRQGQRKAPSSQQPAARPARSGQPAPHWARDGGGASE